jgi:hypothetical protein
LDEDASTFGPAGAGFAPAKLEVVQQGNDLTIRTTRILEYTDDQVTEEKLALDGAASKSEFMHSPRVTTARRSADGTQLVLESTLAPAWAPPGTKTVTTEVWSLSELGQKLSIQRSGISAGKSQETTLVFDRR